MKIRTGFVSNSSSSSFCLVGKYININEINKNDKVYLLGKSLYEGQDVPLLTDEMKNFILKHQSVFGKYQFFTGKKFGDYGNEKLKVSDLPRGKEWDVVSGTEDNYSCDSPERLQTTYVDEEE